MTCTITDCEVQECWTKIPGIHILHALLLWVSSMNIIFCTKVGSKCGYKCRSNVAKVREVISDVGNEWAMDAAVVGGNIPLRQCDSLLRLLRKKSRTTRDCRRRRRESHPLFRLLSVVAFCDIRYIFDKITSHNGPSLNGLLSDCCALIERVMYGQGVYSSAFLPISFGSVMLIYGHNASYLLNITVWLVSAS